MRSYLFSVYIVFEFFNIFLNFRVSFSTYFMGISIEIGCVGIMQQNILIIDFIYIVYDKPFYIIITP